MIEALKEAIAGTMCVMRRRLKKQGYKVTFDVVWTADGAKLYAEIREKPGRAPEEG